MAIKQDFPMTKAKLEELRAELKTKEEIEKPALAARLKAAIEMGDLSENAEYHSAKEDQGFLEGRIQELKNIIRGAILIEESDGKHNASGIVRLGSRVTVVEQGENAPETYLIVGQVEANPLQGKISNESPLGIALVGRAVGDVVRVTAPAGEMVFTIKGVS